MDKFLIKGPTKLEGSVRVSSSKNATLPILCATLLFDFESSFHKLPKLNDVDGMLQLLASLGAQVRHDGEDTFIETSKLDKFEADYELVRKMRASVLVLGPLLARFGKARVSLPGGCAIGSRPVDIHLDGLERMGAKITIENGYICAEAEKLKGAHLMLPFPSVGATENLMMAAVLAEGETIIENVAKEPEILDLANFLNAHGAIVRGAGSSTITVTGIAASELKRSGGNYQVIGDRIEAATYIIAALATQSHIVVEGFDTLHLKFVLDLLVQMGAKFHIEKNRVEVLPSHLETHLSIETAPYPGFPTDVQAQLMVLTCLAKGDCVITESIFENRFMHVPELNRMGADIEVKGKSAFIKGETQFCGAPVMCTDLRASAALVLAGLVAQGETEVRRVYHIDRGYERIDEQLRSLGANITRLKE